MKVLDQIEPATKVDLLVKYGPSTFHRSIVVPLALAEHNLTLIYKTAISATKGEFEEDGGGYKPPIITVQCISTHGDTKIAVFAEKEVQPTKPQPADED